MNLTPISPCRSHAPNPLRKSPLYHTAGLRLAPSPPRAPSRPRRPPPPTITSPSGHRQHLQFNQTSLHYYQSTTTINRIISRARHCLSKLARGDAWYDDGAPQVLGRGGPAVRGLRGGPRRRALPHVRRVPVHGVRRAPGARAGGARARLGVRGLRGEPGGRHVQGRRRRALRRLRLRHPRRQPSGPAPRARARRAHRVPRGGRRGRRDHEHVRRPFGGGRARRHGAARAAAARGAEPERGGRQGGREADGLPLLRPRGPLPRPRLPALPPRRQRRPQRRRPGARRRAGLCVRDRRQAAAVVLQLLHGHYLRRPQRLFVGGRRGPGGHLRRRRRRELRARLHQAQTAVLLACVHDGASEPRPEHAAGVAGGQHGVPDGAGAGGAGDGGGQGGEADAVPGEEEEPPVREDHPVRVQEGLRRVAAAGQGPLRQARRQRRRRRGRGGRRAVLLLARLWLRRRAVILTDRPAARALYHIDCKVLQYKYLGVARQTHSYARSLAELARSS